MFGKRKSTKKTADKKSTTKAKSEPKTDPKPKVEPEMKTTIGIMSAIELEASSRVMGKVPAGSTKTIWPNISVEEATCSHCGEMASAELLDKVQAFRTTCGFAIPFTSICRCPEHNTAIGGSKYSLHLLSMQKNEYGAVDCGIPKAQSKNRWTMLNAARQLGANNIEVCDGHMHIGWAPHGHVMEHRLYWGVSR